MDLDIFEKYFYKNEQEQRILLNNQFTGIQYRLADNWFSLVNVNDFKNKPINYLEIGTFYGANIISVAKTYGLHSDSKLYCIDPWEDYNDYPEYKNQQTTIYDSFINNIEKFDVKDKIVINRGYSNREIPKFQDDFFDIVYIDGNHESEYILEDAILSFRKLKKGGIMIFDDYHWVWHTTQKGIDAFRNCFCNKITDLGTIETQVIIKENE
jgi:predicted O-methyltransferase YrrM